MRALAEIVTIYSGVEKILIGPRAAFGGGVGMPFIESEDAILTCLLGAIEDPGDLDQLRRASDRWLFDDSYGARRDDRRFLQDIASACVGGGLGAVIVPDATVRIVTPVDITPVKKPGAAQKPA